MNEKEQPKDSDTEITEMFKLPGKNLSQVILKLLNEKL